MTREDLEFLIAQYADGTLPSARRADVEAALGADPEARAMLAEYRAIDAALRLASPGLPALDWDGVRRHLSANVADSTDSPHELSEPLEVTIAQAAERLVAVGHQAQLDRALAEHPEAHRALVQYSQLDALLRSMPPTPQVDWDRFAGSISGAIDGHLRGEALSEAEEAAIAAHADGSLAHEEAAAVEAKLAACPVARQAYREYAAIDGSLDELRAATPIPDVKWDALAAQLSNAVAIHAGEVNQASVAVTPARTTRWFRLTIRAAVASPMRLALAASVLVAIGLAVMIGDPFGGDENSQKPAAVVVAPASPARPAAPVIHVVLGPADAEADHRSPRPARAEVRIGPPPGVLSANNGFADDIGSSRPPRATIASDVRPAHDTAGFPF